MLRPVRTGARSLPDRVIDMCKAQGCDELGGACQTGPAAIGIGKWLARESGRLCRQSANSTVYTLFHDFIQGLVLVGTLGEI